MVVSSVAACSSCRRWVLRSFIASIGGPAVTVGRRAFNTSPTSTPPEDAVGVGASIEHETQQPTPENKTRTQEPNPHIPWYLQNQPALPEENEASVSARQRLPDLPSHPPSLLQPLLEHVSISLGMDDLSLLDLRAIDPPPALGANLIMIVGTARSEKHLHVSADRLCRWLRSEHYLSPYADGLLGRQELKVKMRRLAKKKKMMSHVKASFMDSDEGPADDGIRTGWVCVNVGRVEGGELPKSEEQLEREKNIVGFGTGVSGCSLVVQLMTEDKRGEIELERLWMAVMKKSQREQDAIVGEDQQESPVPASVAKDPLAESREHTKETQDGILAGSMSPEETVSVPLPPVSFTPFPVKATGHDQRRNTHRV